MTYSIFSLDSGTILESYTSEDGALDAAARILASEPEAWEAFAVLEIEDRQIVGSCEGDELREVVRQHVDAQHGATA